jgi:IS5 family transposase
MDTVVPWAVLIAVITPFYFSGKRGRPAKGIEIMLRMYFLSIWYNLADEAVEDAIYDSYAMRKFMKIDFLEEDAPDATTLLHFRHMLEEKGLQEKILEEVNKLMEEKGIMMRGGTVVDATIIEAPSSTKNSSKSRDPEMHSAKKGNLWHFGMKAHIGVDAVSGMVHSVEATAANVADIEVAAKLIREDDEVLYGDNGYQGLENRPEMKGEEETPKAECRINKKKGAKRKEEKKIYKDAMNHLEYIGEPKWDEEIEGKKSKVRSKVEHMFGIIKGLYGFRKVRYRGLKKNLGKLQMLFASANLLKYAWAGCPDWKSVA